MVDEERRCRKGRLSPHTRLMTPNWRRDRSRVDEICTSCDTDDTNRPGWMQRRVSEGDDDGRRCSNDGSMGEVEQKENGHKISGKIRRGAVGGMPKWHRRWSDTIERVAAEDDRTTVRHSPVRGAYGCDGVCVVDRWPTAAFGSPSVATRIHQVPSSTLKY
jgi:hypothetical protein